MIKKDNVVKKDNLKFINNFERKFVAISSQSPLPNRIASLETLAKSYARTYWEEDSYESLKTVLQKLDATVPQNSNYLIGLGSLEMSKENNEVGLEYYKQAFKNNQNVEAEIYRGLYAKYLNEDLVYDEAKGNIIDYGSDIDKATFSSLDKKMSEIKDIKINIDIPKDLPKKNHIFILLGYELNEDGTIQNALLQRLKIAKRALDKYPESKIIVTGGRGKNGNTESKLMAKWLEDRGIGGNRIIQENMATDTVENLLYSMKLIEIEGNIKNITIISSVTHIQRSVSILKLVDEIFSKRTNRELMCITNISWLDIAGNQPDKVLDKSSMYATTKDLLRTANCWTFPGISR
ncbi:YdcF family protein [Candidatus Enterococcus leclercqii]|uniref:YdcF family protein n=1 Tax=Candidatus Enterococcus leclercqii TaxID=1857218 RepID=UPI001379B967|nr:YdcF family protein [Enterococcus sp. CU9D]KAF1294188.1 hypothetical protein BAU14_07305 [Enterococcus sp. CU9D]